MFKSILLTFGTIFFWLMAIHKDEMARRLFMIPVTMCFLLSAILPAYFAICVLMTLMTKIDLGDIQLIALVISIPLGLSGLLIYWAGAIKYIISDIKYFGLRDALASIILTARHNWRSYTIWEIEFTNEFVMCADKPFQSDSPKSLVKQLEIRLYFLEKCYSETYVRRKVCLWFLWVGIILFGLLDIFSLSLCVRIINYSGFDLSYMDDYQWLSQLITCLGVGVIFSFFSNMFVQHFRLKVFQKITSVVGQLSATGNFVLLVAKGPVSLVVTPDCPWIDNELLYEGGRQDNYFILRKSDEFWSYAVPTFMDFKRFDKAFQNLRNPEYVKNYLRRIQTKDVNKSA